MDKIALYEALLEDHPLWDKEASEGMDAKDRASLGAKMHLGSELGGYGNLALARVAPKAVTPIGIGLLGSRIVGSYKTRNAARDAGIGDDYEGRGSYTLRHPFLSSITPVAGSLSSSRLAEEVARRSEKVAARSMVKRVGEVIGWDEMPGLFPKPTRQEMDFAFDAIRGNRELRDRAMAYASGKDVAARIREGLSQSAIAGGIESGRFYKNRARMAAGQNLPTPRTRSTGPTRPSVSISLDRRGREIETIR
jgi:hypothetical protein